MPAKYPPAREAAALEIQRKRKLHLKSTLSGQWSVFASSPTGMETSLGLPAFDDQVDALEAAEATMAAGERRAAEAQHTRLYTARQRGVYAPWPRVNGQGQQEWVVLKTSDRSWVAGPFAGLLLAELEIARIHDEPAPIPVEV